MESCTQCIGSKWHNIFMFFLSSFPLSPSFFQQYGHMYGSSNGRDVNRVGGKRKIAAEWKIIHTQTLYCFSHFSFAIKTMNIRWSFFFASVCSRLSSTKSSSNTKGRIEWVYSQSKKMLARWNSGNLLQHIKISLFLQFSFNNKIYLLLALGFNRKLNLQSL